MIKWNVEEFCGYKPITTFWEDFTIAEAFGVSAIRDTFNRAFAEWKTNYKYLTELVMVLNHKIWMWYGKDDTVARVYNELWKIADEYGYNNLTGEEANYFFATLD